jgi:hypothetical protein
MWAFALCCCCISCTQADKPSPSPAPPEVPKALQDNSSDIDVLRKSSSGPEDLVTSLYEELVKNDAGLTELEKQLDQLPERRQDATRLFADYNEKNEHYYASAKDHIGLIKDSVLRRRMEALIEGSDTIYRHLTSGHRELLAGVREKEMSLEDLHTVLKLTRTVIVIGEYQHGHLPGKGALQHILKEYEGAVEKMEGAIKK